jgi:DHA1 family inner membrane transport protein
VAHTGVGGTAAQAKHALAPRVLAVLGLCLLVMGGQFAAFTYLTPYLQSVTGVSGGVISAFLLIYGLANAVGTFAGGWAADRNARLTLAAAVLALVAALAVLYLAGSHAVAAALTLALWGLVGFGLVPSLQYRVVSLAGPGRDLAATLPASAVTLGIAIGSVVGGQALAASGPSAAVFTGLVVCTLALPVALLTGRLKAPRPAADLPLQQPGDVEPAAEYQLTN